MEIEHTSRRLEVKKYLVDTHAIKRKLADHVALVHRELVDISDQSACPSTVFMGCFADIASNRDLALSLGGGFSVEVRGTYTQYHRIASTQVFFSLRSLTFSLFFTLK